MEWEILLHHGRREHEERNNDAADSPRILEEKDTSL